MASTSSQLALLSDHIKLSLLERQRALSLNLDADAQNAEISRSLDSFNEGLRAFDGQKSEDIEVLRQQYTELRNTFDGTGPSVSPSKGHLNSNTLASHFDAASTTRSRSPHKSVHFTDAEHSQADGRDRAALFNRPYQDDPSGQQAAYSDDPSGPPDHSHLDNQQIHAYHTQVLAEQDEQLDSLSGSVRRIGDLSIHIGSELDEQNAMLGDLDGAVTYHQSTIDRARDRVGKIARKAKDNWSITTIAVLVLILVFLIVVLK